MTFRFRRTLKIAPGIRLNLTHRGAGVRVGPKGAGVSVNTSGRKTVSAGIPGSGIHFSQTVSSGKKQMRPARDHERDRDPPAWPIGWVLFGAAAMAVVIAALRYL